MLLIFSLLLNILFKVIDLDLRLINDGIALLTIVHYAFNLGFSCRNLRLKLYASIAQLNSLLI